jgi:hypothetical protein
MRPCGKGSRSRLARCLVFALGVCLVPAQAHAQKLSIQGDRFAVDGVPRFLTFMSLFGAMAAPNIGADLHFLKGLGFDGVRIWPNLDQGPQIFAADGTLKPDELARLRFILDQAKLERMIVDVSFTYEHTPGLTAAGARRAIVAAAEALRSYDNIMFDIQNERNVGDRRQMSEADVAAIYSAVKAVDPARIAFASNSPVDPPEYAADFTVRLGLDVTAYHEPRVSNWYELGTVQNVVRAMKASGRPAYLQEPMSTRDNLFPYPSHDRAEFFMQAIGHAKLAGAAAWCFHTDAGLHYREGPPFIEDRLRQYPEPEWAFVNSLNPKVLLRTANGANYLVAEGGGGAGIRADKTAASPGSWDVFGVTTLGGGPVLADDRIALTTAEGGRFVQATAGGGSTLRVISQSVGAWETFRIEKTGGGVIHHGDSVSLRANDSSWYVVADGGGGRGVSVNSASKGSWETFTILFVSPHTTEAVSARDAAIKQRDR